MLRVHNSLREISLPSFPISTRCNFSRRPRKLSSQHPVQSSTFPNMPKIEKQVAGARSEAAGGGSTRSILWSAQDDETLIQARTQGLNWNQIAPKHFPQKSPNACRKRHERLMERINAAQWDGVKLEVLAQAYMEVRRDMWSILATRVGEKSQLLETKVISCSLPSDFRCCRNLLLSVSTLG